MTYEKILKNEEDNKNIYLDFQMIKALTRNQIDPPSNLEKVKYLFEEKQQITDILYTSDEEIQKLDHAEIFRIICSDIIDIDKINLNEELNNRFKKLNIFNL